MINVSKRHHLFNTVNILIYSSIVCSQKFPVIMYEQDIIHRNNMHHVKFKDVKSLYSHTSTIQQRNWANLWK